MCNMWLYIATRQNMPCTPVLIIYLHVPMLGESPKEYELLARLYPRTEWLADNHGGNIYGPSQSHQGSPIQGDEKNVTVQRQIQSRQQMTDKDRGPQIHNLYINVCVMVHGPQKRSQYWIHFLKPETAWDQLVSLRVTGSQATCCK
jgi:hypothetical protein